MEYIKSKDICYLIMDTMSTIDERLIVHGQKTAYIFYQMLKGKGGYEKYEMAEFSFLAMLHDIGAYKTDNINKLLRLQLTDYMPHSIYGFLFLKYLSPMQDRAKIVLYHHINYSKMADSEFEHKDLADMLHIADTVEIFFSRLKDRFDCHIFEKYIGTRFSKEAVELMIKGVEEEGVLSKLSNGEYVQELDSLMNGIMFTNIEKRQYLEMLMYCFGLRNEELVVDSVTGICIAEELGKKMKLPPRELEILYYAALLRDVGMLGIPKAIIKAHGNLTQAEEETLISHVHTAENNLKNRLHEDILQVLIAHHERADGSGYPNHTKDTQMNMMQRILQVSDAIIDMAIGKTETLRKEYNKQEVVEKLQNELKNKRFNRQVAEILIDNLDEIWQSVEERAQEILAMHIKLNTKYRKINSNFTI